MYGRDMGVNPDDMEMMEAVQETKQEVLENKDVSCVKRI